MSGCCVKTEWPWRLTATGELGFKRHPMLHNELHLRPDLGKRRQRSYMVPDHWIYGLQNPASTGTALQALRGWDLSSYPMVKAPRPSERNFMALNKAAVQGGLVTSHEHYHFRSLNDIRKDISKKAPPRSTKIFVPADATFGLLPRASTPMNEVMANRYGERWLQNQREELAKELKERRENKRSFDVYETKACLMRQYQQPVKESATWHLPRFAQSAKSRLDSFRTEEARRKAMSAFSYDKIARKGNIPFQRGIYTAAHD